jgi:hypothetical protein
LRTYCELPPPLRLPSRPPVAACAVLSRCYPPGRDACARACPLIPPSPCGTASPGTPFCELSVNFGSLRAPVAARRISSLGVSDSLIPPSFCPHLCVASRLPHPRASAAGCPLFLGSGRARPSAMCPRPPLSPGQRCARVEKASAEGCGVRSP